jgi:ferric-dicitrate binding protein FerR (iron transport regulator)
MEHSQQEQLDQDEIILISMRFFTGLAKEDEIKRLESWIKTSPENHASYLQLKNIWEVSDKSVIVTEKNTEESLQKILRKIKDDPSAFKIKLFWQRVAAILFIPLLAGSFLWGRFVTEHSYSKNIVYNEVFAPAGTRSILKLADGSAVWLNSGSSLRYPDKFAGDERKVSLKGEAYFEVRSNIHKPFIVETKSIRVKATRTKFCVEEFQNERSAGVTLVSGKVSVMHYNSSGHSSIIAEMLPNQHLDYDTLSEKSSLVMGDSYKYIAWKDGKLVFRNDPLSEVVRKISQLYNVDIEIRGNQLQDYRYHATFQEESLGEILKLLKISSPINYMEEKRVMLPDGSFPRRKVIIYPAKH